MDPARKKQPGTIVMPTIEMNDPDPAAAAFIDKKAPNLTPDQRAAWLKAYGQPVAGGQAAPGRAAPVTTRTFPKAVEDKSADELEQEFATKGARVQAPGEVPSSRAANPNEWTDQDRQKNATAKAYADRMIARGMDPAKARELAGVQVEPGEIGPQPAAEEAPDENPIPGPRMGAAGGGPGVMISPGGRTPSSWATQTQEGVQLSPETKDLAQQAEQGQFQAAGMHMGADERAAQGELAILRRHELVQQARETELRTRAEQQRKMYEASLGKLDAMTDAVRADQIDPEQWMKSRSAAQKFSAGLGMVLGGFANALNGRGNPGMEMVQGAIKEEIDAQKANVQARRGKLEDQRSLLGQLARTFGDERTAEDAAWILYLERAKTQLTAQAVEAKSDFAKAKYADAIADIKGQIAARREKWDQLEQDRVTRVQHDVNAPPTYAGGAGGAMKEHDEKSNQELTERLVKSGIPGAREDLDRLLAVVPKSGDVPGVGGVAGAVNAVGGPVERGYDRAYNLVGGTQGQEIRQAAAVLFNRQLKDESGAAVSDQELERQKAAFYGARDARSARASLVAYANRLNQLEATIRSGFKPLVNDTQESRRAVESQRLDRKKKFTGPKAD